MDWKSITNEEKYEHNTPNILRIANSISPNLPIHSNIIPCTAVLASQVIIPTVGKRDFRPLLARIQPNRQDSL